MDLQDAQNLLDQYKKEISHNFHKIPGSAMLIRYVRSSYQNDPVRSAIELILVLFFVRYLLAPSYSTQRQNFVNLTEEVGHSVELRARCARLTYTQEIDDLVDEWTPEPLTAPQTAFEEADNEKLPVIVG